MSSYRSAGAIDDPSIGDGDVGFVGMDMRRQAGQLEAGIVSESRNGRMDGYWQPRLGAELLSGALTVDVVPLRIPFFLADDVGGFVGGVSLMVVTGTLVPNLTGTFYVAGEVGGRDSFVKSGGALTRIDWDTGTSEYFLNDVWGITRFRTTNSPASPDAGTWVAVGGSGTPAVAAATSSVTASRTGETVTITSHGHPFDPIPSGSIAISPAWMEIKDFETAGKTVDINGIHLVQASGAYDGTLTFTIAGAPAGVETYVGPGTLISELTDGAVTDILGSCVFSDPASGNDEVIIIATNSVAKKVDLDSPYAVTDLPYPGVSMLGGPVELVQAFDRVMLFRGGERPWHWLPGGRVIDSAAYVSGTGVVTVVCKDHGLTAGDVVTISGIVFSATPTVADPNGTRTVATVTSADTFTFVIATGSGDETYTAGTGKMVADFFTLAPAGVYAQPQMFEIAGDEYGVSDGLLRFSVASNETIRAGDVIFVRETDVPDLTQLVGLELRVTEATLTDIYAYGPVSDVTYASGSAAQVIKFGGRASLGGGFMFQPGAPWGVYFQRRLWVPYFYSPGGTYASPTYDDRGTRDEIAASDLLDPDTFDRIESQFRITAGVADFLVAMHPFYDDALLVLNRNSLHIVVGTQGGLGDTVVKELTREVGCLARKSLASQGNAVFFLSDNGVYGVEFIDGYNLRGISEPMSKPIQPLIDRMNRDLAGNAVGIYFNNRYYLAVPLDTAKGSGDAEGNNSVLVFNMLNKGWESVDTFGDDNFNIIDFHVARAGERNDLYCVNEFGGVHRLESRNDSSDLLSFNSLGGASTKPIDYALVSRGYTLGTQARKRFTRAQVQIQSDSSTSDVDFEFSTEDPDTALMEFGSLSGLLGDNLAPNDSANVRMRLGGVRGYSGQLTISANTLGSAPIGRPKVQSIVLEGTVTNRSTISQH